MTTKVTVEVPSGADYVAKVALSDGQGFSDVTVMPGETFSTFVYGKRFVADIREIPNRQ